MEKKPFQYGDFEGVVDFSDYRVLEKFESDMSEYQQRVQNATAVESYPAQIRGLVEAVAFVFDATFGEGAGERVLGGSGSLDTAMTAFDALVTYRLEQDAAALAGWQQLGNKYSPKNRGQRRTK